jgi:N-methylhydantoinase B
MYHWGSCSGTGATIDRDGFPQLGGLGTLGGLMLPDAELSEQMYPVRVLRQEFREDGGGPGLRRGGTGVIYEVDIDEPAEFVFRGEGVGPPSGLGILGGEAGLGGEIAVVDRAAGGVAVPVFGTIRVGPSRLRVQSAGGGGYGDPRLRDVALVARDVADGVVSVRAARESYGVAIMADGSVDPAETARLRAQDRLIASSRAADRDRASASHSAV